MSRIVSSIPLNYSAKLKAFPYQQNAFEAIKDLDYAAVFHEQGLGKTKIAIDLILYWLQIRDIDTVLIVTKKQLVTNWIDEFSIHTFLHPKVLTNNQRDNFYIFNSPTRVIVTNFEVVSTEKSRMSLFLKSRNVAIIIDESTKIKNPDAKLTKVFFELSSLFKIRIIMSGTPVANRPYDIWAQIYFLDHGLSLGNNFTEFKAKTDLTNKLGKDVESQRKFENAVSDIINKISSFTVRETKKSCSIELPQKVYETIYANFEIVQEQLYFNVLNDMSLEVKQNEKLFYEDESVSLKRLLRLLQITSNPSLVNDDYHQVPGKLSVLDQLLDDIISRGEKCIVWSCFIENIELFFKRYAKYNPQKIHGSLSIEARTSAVSNFKDDPSSLVLFATPQAAKEGLTLTVANNVVFFDRGFNLDDYLQAQDRIHRISQAKTCFIYNLMIHDSVDEWVAALLQAKQSAAFLAQGDITKEEYQNVADYSYGDIIKDILSTGEKI